MLRREKSAAASRALAQAKLSRLKPSPYRVCPRQRTIGACVLVLLLVIILVLALAGGIFISKFLFLLLVLLLLLLLLRGRF